MKFVNRLIVHKKGQLTMFMLVGVVVLISFLFVFFLLNSLAETRMRGKLAKTKAPALTTPIIQFYVSDCLKDVFKEGLIKIGLQGGYFYEGQHGYTYSSGYYLPYTNFSGENVSYLVYPNYNPFADTSANYNLGWPCRTDENAPSYCRLSRDGTNVKYFDFASNQEKIYSTYSDGYSKFRFPNIQKQVEQYIKDKIVECIDFDAVAENFPGYEITFEEPEPRISFGVQSTSVQLNYPIKLTFQDYSPVSIIQEFKTELPVRFRKIFGIVLEFLKSGTRNELNDIDFDPFFEFRDIIDDTTISFRIERSDDSIFDEVYIINDSLSVIDGENYIFQFARRNRPPVLNYIGKYPSYLYNPADTSKDIYDYLTIPINDYNQVYISPNATDPDEDIAIAYSSESDIADLNSTAWNSTLNLFYEVTEADIGYHNVTIRAFDGEFIDVQRVRLLVDPILEPKANVSNIYGTDIYSPEDPFFLNATPTMESLDSFASYIFGWEDFAIIGGELIGIYLDNISYPCIALPSGNECSDDVFDITNMSGINLPMTGRDIILRVNLAYAEISQNEGGVVPVAKQACIPYRNAAPPYPYNNADPTTKEAFLGDHSCCNDDGTIKGTNAVCYQKDECRDEAGNYHYNVYVKNHYCDGERGNICTEDGNITLEPTERCGSCGHTYCVTSFGASTNGGICYGQDGCESVCNKELVDYGESGRDDEDKCDCRRWDRDDRGKNCDLDHNGNYGGTCQWVGATLECVGDS